MFARIVSIVMTAVACLALILAGCAGDQCASDLDCPAGHLCQTTGSCTDEPVSTMAECAAVHPIFTGTAFLEKGRASMFLVVPGGSTDPLWDEHVSRAVQDVTHGPGMDAFVRLVIPDAGSPGGARLVRPVGMDRDFLTKDDGDIAGILQATIHSLAPAESTGAPLLNAGLWALEKVASGEFDDWAMIVAIYFLDDRDDCSADGTAAACDDSQGLVPVGELVSRFDSAIEEYVEASIRNEIRPDAPWVFLAPIFPSATGCTIGGRIFPAAPRYDAFVEQMAAISHTLSDRISICDDDWYPRLRRSVDQYDSMYPMVRMTYIFQLAPVSSDLVSVFLNGVPVNRRDIVYTRSMEDITEFTAEDVWSWFDEDFWQQLDIQVLPGPWLWGDILIVYFCPVYHTDPPLEDFS